MFERVDDSSIVNNSRNLLQDAAAILKRLEDNQETYQSRIDLIKKFLEIISSHFFLQMVDPMTMQRGDKFISVKYDEQMSPVDIFAGEVFSIVPGSMLIDARHWEEPTWIERFWLSKDAKGTIFFFYYDPPIQETIDTSGNP